MKNTTPKTPEIDEDIPNLDSLKVHFLDYPSNYILWVIIETAKRECRDIASGDLQSMKTHLLQSQIRWQEDAIVDWIYNDEETMKRKNKRLLELKEELRSLYSRT